MSRRQCWRISLVSLGCAKNTVDSETTLGCLLGEGHILAPEPADADLVLVNTCAFIAPARQESCEVIAEMLGLKDRRGRPRVAVLGCFPQQDGAELERCFPALDAILGVDAQADLAAVCRRIMQGEKIRSYGPRSGALPAPAPRLLLTPRSYAYVKIADGCDNHCAYCAIPQIRGAFRSQPPEAVVSEARDLVGMGVRE